MQTVQLSVRELVEFVLRSGSIDRRFTGVDRAAQGSRIHRKLQKAAGENYTAEVPMKAERVVDEICYRLEGRADGILREADGIVIDEIKTTAAPAERLTADFSELHWAQAKCYAAFYCADNNVSALTVQLTYYQIDTDEVIRHRRVYTALELEAFLQQTLHLYTPWAQLRQNWQQVRNASLQALNFPFENYREGQYRLAGAVYRTVQAGGRLFAEAPTGIGKTISTLFPALKAMGKGSGERIFYLTAKTLTRTAAQDAVQRMRVSSAGALRLKTLTLTAKDKICFGTERDCIPEACPYANGYYDRINSALYQFLQQADSFDRDAIAGFARENTLCPFELALDLTLFCDCIICDYNYLFDPVVSLQRFFTEGGDYIFLVDEAHNLVDRARDMYSADLRKSDFYAVKKQVGKTSRKLSNALKKVNDIFVEQRHRCEEAPVSTGRYSHTLVQPKGEETLTKAVTAFVSTAQDWLDDHREGELHAAVLELYFQSRFFLRIAELYDEHFTTLISAYGSEVCCRQLCLDASPFLSASLALGRAAVLFSATLSPMEYFIQTLGGGEQAARLRLNSPFPRQNLCLLAADTVSTKYADREATLLCVARMIETVVRAKNGNYLIFAPSYVYMQAVAQQFSSLCPDIPLCLQESGMDEAARENFLARFCSRPGQTLVGFCVLGGIFSEGIDLVGDRLIGTVIVGVGLPQIGPEQDALKEYYQQTLGAGFAYAYQYPGMNKVLQAAGRVIRTPTDRGVVLLVDTRYASSGYRTLLPLHWAELQSVKQPQQAQEKLRDFWNGPG